MNDIEIIELIKGTATATFTLPGLGESTILTSELDSVIKAWKKQIPKKAIEIRDRHNFNGKVIFKDGYCPICKNEMSSTYFYCNKCGQAIDWNKSNDN